MSETQQDVPSESRGLEEWLSDERVLAGLTIVPTGALFFTIVLLPIAWAIYASFHSVPAYSPEWTWVGLENYETVLADPDLYDSLLRSAVFAFGSVTFQVVVGTGIALVINQKFKFSKLIQATILLPYLIPTAIVGFITLWMANAQWGIIGQVVVALGLAESPPSFFGDRNLAMASVILTNSWKFTIFVTIMVFAKLQSIPDDYYEVASIAGANTYQKFRDITLPNLKGILFIVILLRSIWMFNKFDIIWVMTRGGPEEVTTTLPVFAYRVAFASLRLGEAAAVSVLIFVMIGVGAFVYFRVFEPSQEVRVE